MSFVMKCLSIIVLVFGVIGALASPLTVFSTLLNAVIGFGMLYSVGEMLSLMGKIHDAEKDMAKTQKENSDLLKALIQEKEQKLSPDNKENPERMAKQEEVHEKSCDYGTGKAITVDETTIKCPSCGKLQKGDRTFCYYCGMKFEGK